MSGPYDMSPPSSTKSRQPYNVGRRCRAANSMMRARFKTAKPWVNNHQRVGTLALGRCEGWLKVVGMTGGQRLQRYAEHRCSGFGFLHLQSRCRLPRVVEDADAVGLRERPAQHLKSFCGQVCGHVREARNVTT